MPRLESVVLHHPLSASFGWVRPQGCGYHFGVGVPPILVYFSGDWDVHSGYGIFDPWPCGQGCVG